MELFINKEKVFCDLVYSDIFDDAVVATKLEITCNHLLIKGFTVTCNMKDYNHSHSEHLEYIFCQGAWFLTSIMPHYQGKLPYVNYAPYLCVLESTFYSGLIFVHLKLAF